MPATYTQISDRRRRLQPGQADHLRLPVNRHKPPQQQEENNRTCATVRPYLLNRFRTRYTRERRSFSKQQRDSILHDLSKYTKRPLSEIRREYPFNEEFFEKIQSVFNVFLDYPECCVSIVQFDGHPRLCIESDFSFTNQICLEIGGLDSMKEGPVKDTAMLFVATLKETSEFYISNLWYELIEEGQVNEDLNYDEDYTKEYAKYLEGFLSQKNILEKLAHKLTQIKPEPKEILQEKLSSLHPTDEKERALVELMKKGICYLYEKCWKPSDHDEEEKDCHTSVLVCPWDNFCLSYRNNIIRDCELLLWKLFDGDHQILTRETTYILDDKGCLYNIFDREGYSNFIIDLSNQLNKFFNE